MATTSFPHSGPTRCGGLLSGGRSLGGVLRHGRRGGVQPHTRARTRALAHSHTRAHTHAHSLSRFLVRSLTLGVCLGCVQWLRSCELYDPTTHEWAEIPEMPSARAARACLLSDGRVAVIGGWTDEVSLLSLCLFLSVSCSLLLCPSLSLHSLSLSLSLSLSRARALSRSLSAGG